MNTNLFTLRLLRGEAPLTMREWLNLSQQELGQAPLPKDHPLNLLLSQPRSDDEAITLLRETEHQRPPEDEETERQDRVCLEQLTICRVTNGPDSGHDPLTPGVLWSLIRLRFIARLIYDWAVNSPSDLPRLCQQLREELHHTNAEINFPSHEDYLRAAAPELNPHVLTAMLAAYGEGPHPSPEEEWIWSEAEDATAQWLERGNQWTHWDKPEREVLLTLIQANLRLKAEFNA